MIKVKQKTLDLILRDKGIQNPYQLSKALNIDYSYVHKVIHKDRAVGHKFQTALMDFTGMDFSDLFYFAPNSPKGNKEISSNPEKNNGEKK